MKPHTTQSALSGLQETDLGPEGAHNLFEQLGGASRFLRDVRVRLRYGRLSRAPLRLLRFQLSAEHVECDWMCRTPDRMDIEHPSRERHRHASLQALRDAIEIRALIFNSMPEVKEAHLRAFRPSSDNALEMIVSGFAYREDHSSRNLHSVVKRARILGFRFHLEEDRLQSI